MSNLDLWNAVSKTDPAATKKVTFGRGFTAIDPHSQIKCATEQFGPAGEGWGWSVERVEQTITNEVAVLVRMWHGKPENSVDQWGQAGLYTDNAESKKDSDAFKKATTDGLTKCLSYLGFNADVFEGKFDDNKYVAQMRAEKAAGGQAPAGDFATAMLATTKSEDGLGLREAWDATDRNVRRDAWKQLNSHQKSEVRSLLQSTPDDDLAAILIPMGDDDMMHAVGSWGVLSRDRQEDVWLQLDMKTQTKLREAIGAAAKEAT